MQIDEYFPYIIAAWLVAALILTGLTVASIRTLKKNQEQLNILEETQHDAGSES